ncbi:Bifunctional 3-dehydroquinate dehydratase/shikimate dehydrogenase-like protein [Melia azedarach]|uniref:Bifunctional 3-dehydroquinate dehydratase/shikimate dehydrogenase-like protein n=1 Tax=Melia azedarach TaxID=155640 RepID=A0ACC1WQ83_MELAZ|nr:Bifunctional 3-dehydroquinate dehydratase/shikimate dehydrogenase-like protein [Melia azedarach]
MFLWQAIDRIQSLHRQRSPTLLCTPLMATTVDQMLADMRKASQGKCCRRTSLRSGWTVSETSTSTTS